MMQKINLMGSAWTREEMKSEKSHFSHSKEKGHSKVNKTLDVASVTIVTVNL